MQAGSGPVSLFSDANVFFDNLDKGNFTQNQNLFLNILAHCGKKTTVPKNPIILLPGIMGSRLFNDTETEELWPNLCRILTGPIGLSPLMFDKNGGPPANTTYPNIHTKPGRAGILDRFTNQCTDIKIKGLTYINEDFYETIINHFTSLGGLGYTEGVDFFIFPYDWRTDISTAATELNTLVDQVLVSTGAQKVQLVAHSMGGLVARSYLSMSSSSGKVERMVTLGTPYLGTPKSLAVLEGLDCALKEIKLVTVGNIQVSACIPDKLTSKSLVGNLPGFYELFPSLAYFQVKGSGFYSSQSGVNVAGDCPECLNYISTYGTSNIQNINTGILTISETFHQAIDNQTNWFDVPVSLIVGTGQQTIAGMRPVNLVDWSLFKIDTPIVPITDLNGDGTVTTISAGLSGLGGSLRGTATYQEVIDEHGNLVKDPIALGWLDYYLGLSSVPPSQHNIQAVQTGVQIIATGAKALDAVDGLGNHTGVVPEFGLEEMGIPGSQYFQQDSLATSSLVGGQSYTLTVTPLGDRPVDLTILRTGSDGSITTQTYTGIPVTSQSRVRLEGDPATVDTWELDPDGSGTNLQPINPTVTYNPGETIDTTSPVATISIDGTPGLQGWYANPVTVTLEASDVGSGVQRIEYAFNNDRTPRVYSGPFIADPAQVGLIMVVAIDNAGNVQDAPAIARIGPDHIYIPNLMR